MTTAIQDTPDDWSIVDNSRLIGFVHRDDGWFTCRLTVPGQAHKGHVHSEPMEGRFTSLEMAQAAIDKYKKI